MEISCFTYKDNGDHIWERTTHVAVSKSQINCLSAMTHTVPHALQWCALTGFTKPSVKQYRVSGRSTGFSGGRRVSHGSNFAFPGRGFAAFPSSRSVPVNAKRAWAGLASRGWGSSDRVCPWRVGWCEVAGGWIPESHRVALVCFSETCVVVVDCRGEWEFTLLCSWGVGWYSPRPMSSDSKDTGRGGALDAGGGGDFEIYWFA